MDSTEGLKDEQTRILNEVLQASHQKEVVDQHLREKKTQDMRTPGTTGVIMMSERFHWELSFREREKKQLLYKRLWRGYQELRVKQGQES